MFDQFYRELAYERESYRRLSETSKKMREVFGETEDLYVKRSYLKRLDALYQREAQPNAGAETDQRLLDMIASEREALRSNLQGVDVRILPNSVVEALRANRVNLIRSAIREGTVVPARVIAQYPRGFFDEDFRTLPRYVKACHTVFSNRSRQVDESLMERYGIRLRRQDGKLPGETEKQEIAAALDEIFAVVGDLSGIMRAAGLTIVHTAGKRIFRYPRHTCGVYQCLDQTITVGVRGENESTDLTSLAHELVGHWLDTVSTPPQSWIDALAGGEHTFLRETMHTSFIDATLRGNNSVYPRLILHMIVPPEECPPALRPLVNSSELWARCAEQMTAERLKGRRAEKLLSVCEPESYYRSVGYWQEETWKEWLAKAAGEQLWARIWMAESIYGLRGNPTTAETGDYVNVFPWAKKFLS